ncbi:MAG TPA: ammonium transporter [Bacteroidales bacterium]|nr:ammonium transporter [Bacteroidales bacterium]
MLMPIKSLFAQAVNQDVLSTLTDVQKYYRAIHVMAMLLLGFGFLMVFVRKYGRSALTATFLLVSVSIPAYIIFAGSGVFGDNNLSEIDTLILSEFAAASLLITAGAVLGRLKMYQYLILGVLFIPVYMLNEDIMLNNGFGLIQSGSFIDVGGSIVIHMFGAIFGLGVAMTMTTKNEFKADIDTDFTSDRFSLLGSMMLWVFWPSFCSALVLPEEVVHTAINVIFALSGATVITYMFTIWLRGKIDAADIANASLAGGVAIGSVCSTATTTESIIIGGAAGAISTIGFTIIQARLQKGLKLIDTCGVSNLHGIPGLFGGLSALLIIPNINVNAQLEGIGLTILISIAGGLITGKLISFTGRRKAPYIDSEEFILE